MYASQLFPAQAFTPHAFPRRAPATAINLTEGAHAPQQAEQIPVNHAF